MHPAAPRLARLCSRGPQGAPTSQGKRTSFPRPCCRCGQVTESDQEEPTGFVRRAIFCLSAGNQT